MESVIINVVSKVMPAEGKKQGKITDHTGKNWYVWANELVKYNEGQQYQITKYKTSAFKGVIYYQIEEAVATGGNPGAMQQGGGGVARPAPVLTYTNPETPITESQRQLNIFICGGFNNMMANPNVNPAMLSAADLAGLIVKMKEAWTRSMVKNQDMNDDIPF